MNVLLTGGAGFIGSHTAVELIAAGHGVVIADDLSNSSAAVIERLARITGARVPFYRIDVADKAALARLFAEHDLDAVIHFAGLKAVGESVAKPLLYYRNNLDTTLALLEVMAAHGCKRFIFSRWPSRCSTTATIWTRRWRCWKSWRRTAASASSSARRPRCTG